MGKEVGNKQTYRMNKIFWWPQNMMKTTVNFRMTLKVPEFNEWQISFILNELIEFNMNEIQHVADSA